MWWITTFTWMKIWILLLPLVKSRTCIHRFSHTFRWRHGKRCISSWWPCACVWGVDTASCPGSRSYGPVYNEYKERKKKKKRTTANKSLSGLTFVTFRAAFMSGYPAHMQRWDTSTKAVFLGRWNKMSGKVLWEQSDPVWQRSALCQQLVAIKQGWRKCRQHHISRQMKPPYIIAK